MTKLKLLLAFALGYVAGAAAGRQRYEQLRRSAQRVAADPRVRSATRKAADTVAEKAPVVASAVKEKTFGAGTGSSSDDLEPAPPAHPEGAPLS